MARKCDEAGLPLLSVWAKDVIVMDDVEIAEGALVSPYVTFTSNIKVGRCFHANLYSYVEHDCVIGRSEEHTSELQSLMRISSAVFCLKKKQITYDLRNTEQQQIRKLNQ